MKRKIGKAVIPVILLLAVLTIALWPMVKPVFARTIGEVGMRLGEFTGPIAGVAQDDNVKASLDIVHDYRRKVIKKAQTGVQSGTPDLFDVDGGAIIITDFYGLCTTTIGGTTTTIQIDLDADTGFVDGDFSTAVAITNDSAGFRYVFTAANESVLTPLEGASGGATSLFKSWFCGEGMIECTASTADNTGAITWYMEYVPLDSGVTVTAQ